MTCGTRVTAFRFACHRDAAALTGWAPSKHFGPLVTMPIAQSAVIAGTTGYEALARVRRDVTGAG
jgi:hypothetical protein